MIRKYTFPFFFISKTNNDFIIDVYNIDGDRLQRIQYDYENIKVNQIHKDEHLNILTSCPGWEQYFESRDAMRSYQ